MKIVVVTPEKAVLEATADMVILPMFDGERGVQRGHAAFVGQLSKGELRVKSGAESKKYKIDGGFVQVAKNVVNVLTAKATTVSA